MSKKKTKAEKAAEKKAELQNEALFTLQNGRSAANRHQLWLLNHDAALPDELKPWDKALKALGDKKDQAATHVLTDTDGKVNAIVRLPKESDAEWRWSLSKAVAQLPNGEYWLAHYAGSEARQSKLLLGWALAQYQYVLNSEALASDKQSSKFGVASSSDADQSKRLVISDKTLLEQVKTEFFAISLVRDLINQPPNVLHAKALGKAVKTLAKAYGAKTTEITGDKLLEENYPAIHAVGRAATAKHQQPRLVELNWGDKSHPKVSLVGKGVIFDSGGLNIKPGASSRYMKKDMGGAAHVLGVAQLIMEANLPVNLQVLVPAVENAISGDAFRPGDIINTRLGKTVEIDNTDAEGRLILCDALAKAAEDETEIIIDFATLTGAARVAMGTEVPAFFARTKKIRHAVESQSEASEDLMWSLPLHEPYRADLKSHCADMKNSGGGYGGAITAALYLATFVPESIDWVHIDVMAWNQASKPGRPVGGEAMGALAIFDYLKSRFGE